MMMLLSRFRALCCLILGLASHGALGADCQLSFDGNRVDISLTGAYTPDAETKADQTLKIKNEGDNSCKFFITIVPSDSAELLLKDTDNRANVLGISYKIKHNGSEILGGIKDSDSVKAAGAANVISGEVGPGQVQDITISASLTENKLRAAGSYSQALNYFLYEGEYSAGATPEAVMTVSGSTDLNIEKQIKMSLTSEGVNVDKDQLTLEHTVDLGELTQENEKTMSLHIQTNNGYTLTFESENGGNLVHTSEGKQDQKIPYTMTLDGSEIKPHPLVSAPGSLSTSQAAGGLSPQYAKGAGTVISFQDNNSKHTLSFKVTSPSEAKKNNLAGDYKDVITVTAKTQD